MAGTPTVGLLVTIEAKPGRERDVEQFLDSGLSLVNQEPGTALWFALHLGGSRYGIFDAFLDDDGRDAHLHGKVAEALSPRPPICSPDRPTSRRSTFRPRSYPDRTRGRACDRAGGYDGAACSTRMAAHPPPDTRWPVGRQPCSTSVCRRLRPSDTSNASTRTLSSR